MKRVSYYYLRQRRNSTTKYAGDFKLTAFNNIHPTTTTHDHEMIDAKRLCINVIPSEVFGIQKRVQIIRDSYGGYGSNSSAGGMSASSLSTPADIGQIFNIPLPRIMKLMQSDSIWVKEA